MLLYQITISYIVLGKSQDSISKASPINAAISNHYFIYCTRKIPKAKYNKHKKSNVHSLRNYSVDAYKQTLERILFLNYENFDNLGRIFIGFIDRFNCAVKAILPFKTVKFKSNTKGWFYGETAEKIHKTNRLYTRFKLKKIAC